MQEDFRPARRAWLAVIVLVHAAVFLCWRGTRAVLQDTARRESELIYLQPAGVQPKSSPAPAAPPAARRHSAPPPPAISTASAPASSHTTPAAPEAVTVPATAGDLADPFAKPAAPTETFLEKNRKLAAGVDRQLRKESLNKFATIVQEDTPLARQLARAYKGEVVLEQVSDIGDGRTMKRYRAGGQEWCEVVNLVGAAGQDPFRDGNKVQVKTCP